MVECPQFWCSGCRARWISVSLRPAFFTEWFPGQLGLLHTENLSWKNKQTSKIIFCVVVHTMPAYVFLENFHLDIWLGKAVKSTTFGNKSHNHIEKQNLNAEFWLVLNIWWLNEMCRSGETGWQIYRTVHILKWLGKS